MKKTNQLISIRDQNWDDKILAILRTSYVLFSLWEIRRSWNGAVNLSPDGATVFALTLDFSRQFREPSLHNVRLPTRRALQTIRKLRWMMNQGGIISRGTAVSTNHSASVHIRTLVRLSPHPHVGGLKKSSLTVEITWSLMRSIESWSTVGKWIQI